MKRLEGLLTAPQTGEAVRSSGVAALTSGKLTRVAPGVSLSLGSHDV
jgi:hypothetical protein